MTANGSAHVRPDWVSLTSVVIYTWMVFFLFFFSISKELEPFDSQQFDINAQIWAWWTFGPFQGQSNMFEITQHDDPTGVCVCVSLCVAFCCLCSVVSVTHADHWSLSPFKPHCSRARWKAAALFFSLCQTLIRSVWTRCAANHKQAKLDSIGV